HSGKADIKKDCRRESKVSWGILYSLYVIQLSIKTQGNGSVIEILFSFFASVALRKLKAGDLEQEDQNLKCYLKCLMMRHGILDNNAEVDVQRALRHLPRRMQDSSKILLDKCKSVRDLIHNPSSAISTIGTLNCSFLEGTDPCDKAYNMVKCYVGHHPEVSLDLDSFGIFVQLRRTLFLIRVADFAERPFLVELSLQTLSYRENTFKYSRREDNIASAFV
ncbi:unnamed protein product, partial [Heterotrigona itama]